MSILKNFEKKLKTCLKSKKRITISLIINFIISGSILAADIEFHGDANEFGNPPNMNIPNKEIINGIDIGLEGIKDGYWTETTAALVLKKDYKINGDINIVNTITADKIDNNDGLFVDNNANVEIKGDNFYIASIGGKEEGNGSTAITADPFSNVEIEAKKVQLIGNIDMRFSEVKVGLNSKASFWYGDEQNILGTLDLTLSNGAEWIYNKNSKISKVTLDKGGIINLQDDDIKYKYENTVIKNGNDEYKLSDYRDSESHKKVTISTLKGTGGTFKLDIDWETNQGNKNETEKSDYIYITTVDNTASNSIQTISFDSSKANLEKMKEGDKLYFANVKNGETSFTTIYGDSWTSINPNNIFDYNHFIGQDNKDWYIGLSEKGIGKNGNYKMAEGATYATYFLGTEMDNFTKRINELDYLEGNEGIWIRHNFSKIGWKDTFKTDSNMVQLGYNKKLNSNSINNHYIGMSIEYTDSKTSIPNVIGEGENNRYSISLYNTWINENGHYYDFIIRGGRIDNDYDTKGIFTNGIYDIGNKYHQNFGNISGEYGLKYDLSGSWYVKPQAQLQLTYIDGVDYVSNSGIKVEEEDAKSLLSRVGLNLGYEYGKNNYYIKADLLHEFMGEKGFTLIGNDGYLTKEFEDKETWINLGIGGKIFISENVSLWADIEHTFRSDFENTWQSSIGFTYKW